MRNVRRWKKLCAPVLAAACFAGTVGQNFTGSCSFVQAAETESETEAETVYSQEDLELLNSLDQAEAEGVDGLDADSIDWGKAEIQVMEDEEVSNILLIGQDRRKREDRPARLRALPLCHRLRGIRNGPRAPAARDAGSALPLP